MAKRPVLRFLKQDAFFGVLAHAVYAHSLLAFLCDIEYASLEQNFILASREALDEEFEVIREIILQNFPNDPESIAHCEDYLRKSFGVGLEIFNLTPPTPVKLHIITGSTPMIEPLFLKKDEMMEIIGHASVAQQHFMKMDHFHISDSKDAEERSLVALSAILVILLRELSLHAPLIPLCEEFVMKEYELSIPMHLL